MSVSVNTIIIIGAGPKAMAIAAKSVAMRKIGLNPPKIHIIEKNQIGANWKGSAGFTNGKMELGTSPEKDIGFPYQSTPEINRAMWDFSWHSFLTATGEYASWIDRGRPAPSHEKWGTYLSFVADHFDDNVTISYGSVVEIDKENDQWRVEIENSDGVRRSALGVGLVVTGPGKAKMNIEMETATQDSVYDLESFWKKINHEDAFGRAKKVAIVGAGENAASCVLALHNIYGSSIQIDIISPLGSIYSRGESHFENRVYSNPKEGKWEKLSLKDRREFIARTDLGVFSVHAMGLLNKFSFVNIVPGRARKISRDSLGNNLSLEVSYYEEVEVFNYDKVIMATGHDQLAFLDDLLTSSAREALLETEIKALTSEEVSLHIDADLSLKNFFPKLHLPMVSGIRQGPGFANLSTLGRLSDQILNGYLS